MALRISDNEGLVLAVNRDHQKMTGYSFEDWKNIGIANLYEGLNDRNWLPESVQETERVQDWEAEFKRNDSTEFIALMNLEQLEIAARTVFFTTVRDISDLKWAQQEPLERDEAIRKLSMLPILSARFGLAH
jgi:PAS domain S-box-containing protein